jgi:hypothetical protein
VNFAARGGKLQAAYRSLGIPFPFEILARELEFRFRPARLVRQILQLRVNLRERAFRFTQLRLQMDGLLEACGRGNKYRVCLLQFRFPQLRFGIGLSQCKLRIVLDEFGDRIAGFDGLIFDNQQFIDDTG